MIPKAKLDNAQNTQNDSLNNYATRKESLTMNSTGELMTERNGSP